MKSHASKYDCYPADVRRRNRYAMDKFALHIATLKLCILAIFGLCSAQAFGQESFDPEAPQPNQLGITLFDVQAIHAVVAERRAPFEIFTLLVDAGVIANAFRITSDFDRPPDIVLFFNGAEQQDDYCLADKSLRRQLNAVDSGAVLAAVILDDNPNEQYDLAISTKSASPSPGRPPQWYPASNMSALFSDQPHRILPLSEAHIPNIPYYILRVLYFRIVSPCEIGLERIDLPGQSIPIDFFSVGIGPALVRQKEAVFSVTDNVATLQSDREKEWGTYGRFTFNIFPGREPDYFAALPWDRRFFDGFYKRINVQGSIGFTLNSWFAGAGFTLYKNFDIIAGVAGIPRPAENDSLRVTNPNSLEIEDNFPETAQRFFFFGINVNWFQF